MGAQENRVTRDQLYNEALQQGVAYEHEAYRCLIEAEQAYRDAGQMKKDGRARAAGEAGRMLPQHERATDVRTNTFKDVADAKGDHVYYSAQAQMYASLASMKFAKASALAAGRLP
jgi:hypothetical protein